MKITKTILIEIAHQIVVGNPYWGLALLNRYQVPAQLRHALQERFRARVGSQAHASSIAAALLQGSSLQELSPESVLAVGSRAVRPLPALPRPRQRARVSRICARTTRRAHAPAPSSMLCHGWKRAANPSRKPVALHAI